MVVSNIVGGERVNAMHSVDGFFFPIITIAHYHQMLTVDNGDYDWELFPMHSIKSA